MITTPPPARPDAESVTLDSIRAARQRIQNAIYRSPCAPSTILSRLCGCRIFCKLDHLQMTGSFKERGARNRLLMLDTAARARGVVAASAGNHALGLASHGRDLGIPVTVVMPRWAPLVKVTNCRLLGAEVILHGDAFAEAYTLAQQLGLERGLTFVSAYDDPDIIAGQGTLGLEILEDCPQVDAIIVPVGGGGLISGLGVAVKALRPDVRIIAVEPKNAPTLSEALRAGRPVPVKTRPTLADGLAVATLGQHCFPIVRRVVDDVVLVDEGQIAHAILRLLEMEKTVVEGAGAVPLAAAQTRTLGLDGKNVVLVLCGGNIDVTLIARVIERGLAADGRLCRINLLISDRPGSLAALLQVIASTGASIKEVSHDRSFGPADVERVAVSCVLETRDADHIQSIKAAIAAAGIEFYPLDGQRATLGA